MSNMEVYCRVYNTANTMVGRARRLGIPHYGIHHRTPFDGWCIFSLRVDSGGVFSYMCAETNATTASYAKKIGPIEMLRLMGKILEEFSIE